EQEAFVAGARIILTEKPKGLVRESESDTGGSFLFPFVSPGVYSVRVTKAGFSTWELSDLTVEVGQHVALDVELRIGEFRTSVTVSSSGQTLLDTESNVIGTVVDSTRVRDLPLNGRNFLQLALLAGGAADVSPFNDNVGANVGQPARMIVLPGTLP